MMQRIAKRFGSRFLVCIGLLCVVGESIAEKEKKDFSHYEVIGRVDLFKRRVKEIKAGGISEAGEMGEYLDPKQIAELRSLLITGIVSVGDDYRVIVEEGEKSYYLRVGHEIKGAEILRIQKDRAILSYQGRQVELLFERKARESSAERRRTTGVRPGPPSGALP